MKTSKLFSRKPGSLQHLHLICSATAALLGLAISCVDRYAMWPDGISYLDMGDAYLCGDWQTALNGLWSPLYSWLLGLALFLIKPSIMWEFPVVHQVNFLIFLFALASFHLFLDELIKYYHSKLNVSNDISSKPYRIHIFTLLSYSIFLWSSIKYINLWIVTPDMLIAAFIYLISAIIVRCRMGRAGTYSFVILGILLGLSYLTKTIMFPMAFVFLVVTFLAGNRSGKELRNTLFALAVFVLISSPYILALSHAKGYFTLGDSGRLNYAWHVNGIPKWLHWQGNPAEGGVPEHPTRIVFSSPTVYEFDGPIGGTYPPFYDPSYWYTGVEPHFDLHRQITAILTNMRLFLVRFAVLQGGILACLLLLFVVGREKRAIIRSLGDLWFLLLPPLIALFLYLLVHFEQRYWGGYNVIVLCASLLAAILGQGNDCNSRLKLLHKTMLFIITMQIVLYSLYMINNRSLKSIYSDFLRQEAVDKDRDFFSSTPSRVAEFLRQGIVEPGDKVACIERLNGMYSFWARLARVRIVAEIHGEDVDRFWRANDDVKRRVLEAFAATGAKILVLAPPDYATGLNATDARRIADTHYYYVRLKNQ